MYYAIRITPKNIQTAISTVRGYFIDRYIIASEVSKREVPHIHVVVSTEKDTKAIRAYLKRKLDLTGNAELSVKQVHSYTDEDTWPVEACAYLFKQDTPEVKGIPQEVLDSIHDYNTKVKEEIRQKAESRKTINQALDEFIIPKYFQDGSEHLPNLLYRSNGGYSQTIRMLLKDIISILVDRRANITKSSIEAKFNYYMCRFVPSFSDSLIDDILKFS